MNVDDSDIRLKLGIGKKHLIDNFKIIEEDEQLSSMRASQNHVRESNNSF